MPHARATPSWVIDDDYEDEELGTLRAGKEAGCFLVRRVSGERFCLLVRKDYRVRSDRAYKSVVRAGERGIRRDVYVGAGLMTDSLSAARAGGRAGDARMMRAAAKRTSFGREVIEGAWAGREFAALRRLWEAGASVPFPVEATNHGFLMQYVGTLGAAAPRLSDVRLDRHEARAIFDRVVEQLRILAFEGVVHGDLSAYNVLVQHGRPWIIDLPQVVDLFEHERGAELFARDVANLCRFFAKRGVGCDADRLTSDLLSERT